MAPSSVDSPIATPQAEAAEETTIRRPRWELAECNCPELCERDHELD